MGIKETNTYVIRKPEEPAYKAVSNSKLEKDDQGILVPYSKDDVVDVVSDLINSKVLSKGDKIETKNDKYVIYRFVYKQQKSNVETVKYAHRVKILKAYYNENKQYTDRLDALVKASHAIRTVNNVKIIAIGIAATLVMSDFVSAFFDTSKNEDHKKTEEISDSLQEINANRKENNCSPLGATYEDGTDFEGSYQDWVKYISGYTDKNGNVIEEEQSEPKTYQKSN